MADNTVESSVQTAPQTTPTKDIKSKLESIDFASKKKLILATVAVVVLIIIGSGISSAIKTGKAISTFEDYLTSERYDKAIQHLNQNYDNESFLKKAEKKTIKLYNQITKI